MKITPKTGYRFSRVLPAFFQKSSSKRDILRSSIICCYIAFSHPISNVKIATLFIATK